MLQNVAGNSCSHLCYLPNLYVFVLFYKCSLRQNKLSTLQNQKSQVKKKLDLPVKVHQSRRRQQSPQKAN